MSIEEIIYIWKYGHPKKRPGKTPDHPANGPGIESSNPAGELELDDEELEAAEGGLPEFLKSLNESCYEICKDKE